MEVRFDVGEEVFKGGVDRPIDERKLVVVGNDRNADLGTVGMWPSSTTLGQYGHTTLVRLSETLVNSTT